MAKQDDPYEFMQGNNSEAMAKWRIDPHQDPYSIPLPELNPAHPTLFEANTMLPYFQRLRAEAPVHKTEVSQFGEYWNITKFNDIKYVDTNHDLFSSDSRNGGIRLGGVPLADEEPDLSLIHI